MNKLRQIATEVGVSPNTVLRVLRGENKEIWPSAMRRAGEIRQWAKKLGYLPNGSARAVRRGKFDCVSLLLSADRGHSYLPDELFNHIHDALAEEGMRLVVSKLADEKLTDEQVLPAILREMSCDGLLINYTDHIPSDMIKLIRHYEIPSIWINARLDADCVYYDDFGGAMALTEHLLQLGHRKITYLDFTQPESAERTHYSRIDRYAGYAQAMRSAGVTPVERTRFAGVPIEGRLETTRQLMTSTDRPTALIAYDAGERLVYAASLAGLRIPQDISLAHFSPARAGGAGGEMYFGRRLTAAHIPTDRAGAEAVAVLLEKIADRKTKLPPRVVPLQLDIGDTTGPALT